MIGSVEAIKLLHSYGGKEEYQTPTSDYYKRHYYDHHLEDCRPVLQRATCCGQVECVKVLLDYGASLTCCSERFGEPLICAVKNGQTSILALMIAAVAKGSKSIDEALKAAAVVGHLDCVRLLLAEGADKELLNFGADHLFFNDVRIEENDPFEVISVLLDNNGDDNAGTYFEQVKNIGTPLHFAAVRGDHAFMEFLLSNGAKPNEVNSVRKTALHCCVASCIELLVANGAEINATDYSGWTALHFAVKYGTEDCIAKLIALGADQAPAPAVVVPKKRVRKGGWQVE